MSNYQVGVPIQGSHKARTKHMRSTQGSSTGTQLMTTNLPIPFRLMGLRATGSGFRGIGFNVTLAPSSFISKMTNVRTTTRRKA